MDRAVLRGLLEAVRRGDVEVEGALESLRSLPYEDLGFARVDHHRALRTGHPEVIFAQGKSAAQVSQIALAMARRGSDVLATRLLEAEAAAVDALLRAEAPEAPWSYDPVGRTLLWRARPFEDRGRGLIAVVCAGTTDLPVAMEAMVTAQAMGNRAELITDVGVAGLHRLLAQRERINAAEVVIAVAGMEGALAGVLTGLIDRPVIGVPTSVGYGASFGGVSALLTMLNSCAAGLTVVNIDNGFGAAVAASQINRARP
jgi:NCAIR mutase (PurE)-related protein